ncbi:hypothetical protein [Paenibacillus nasutitermitis]|uniref:Uncharacterized protein n=1 Tax=Paenibacillus nasutitermitis TaxID=1652958 RepID=A0A916Z6Z6_9BACL|nr:hypothetical protein [Paenibacillus nasutitermitis]GGD79087.1 hypothetical protein GCM10010911_41430 [Paenibacillus nasutitermitis]
MNQQGYTREEAGENARQDNMEDIMLVRKQQHNSQTAKKVAVIVTEYRFNSHADMILGRLLSDHSYFPRVEVVSIYTDQVPANDMSREAAARLDIPICLTIRDAVGMRRCGVHVDGVIIIAEHGVYPDNEKGQTLYPRLRMLEETLTALDEFGLNVPVFSDKHLSWNMEDALWMFDQLKKRDIPFMGGSSIPHADPVPHFEPASLLSVKEIVVVSFSNLIEAYGFHALEVLQSLAERRAGGESGVNAIDVLQGAEVWRALDRGLWPEDLLLKALTAYPGLIGGHPREAEPSPILFIIEYKDGLRGFVIQFQSLVEQWGFAFRFGDNQMIAARCDSDNERPFGHFERLTRLIEDFIITRTPPFPPERTLLTTGMIHFIIESLHRGGGKIETPELAIDYE